MNTPATFDDDQREQLVAYLDGELDASACAEIEQTLAESAAARGEVRALTKTWELLDTLPRAAASPDFTEKTLATLQTESRALQARQAAVSAGRPRGAALRRWVPVLIALGWAAAAAAGFFAARALAPNRSEDLVRELPLIQSLDTYEAAGDAAFLERIQGIEGFRNDRPPADP
jgi:anti-sigma factor RsiW